MIIKHATETSIGVVKWRKTRFFESLEQVLFESLKNVFSPFYDPSWCFCCMIYYQSLADPIRNIFYFDTCVKKSKATPENAKTCFKSNSVIFDTPRKWFVTPLTSYLPSGKTKKNKKKNEKRKSKNEKIETKFELLLINSLSSKIEKRKSKKEKRKSKNEKRKIFWRQPTNWILLPEGNFIIGNID